MDKAGKIFSLILTLALFTASIVCSIISASGASGTGGSIFFLCMTVFFAGATGICVIVFYLGGFSEKFALGLIFPRKFLKKPPLELSQIAALIANGENEKAKIILREIIAEHPDSAEAVELFVMMQNINAADSAEIINVAEKYLTRINKEKSEVNAKILFRFAELAVANHENERVLRLLKNALSEECYSKYEKELIIARINNMRA